MQGRNLADVSVRSPPAVCRAGATYPAVCAVSERRGSDYGCAAGHVGPALQQHRPYIKFSNPTTSPSSSLTFLIASSTPGM